MSYSCEISFKEINPKEVYDFLVTLKNKLIDNIENIAKDNYMYAPFVRYQHKPYTKLESYSDIECNNSWVKQVFTYRYFYLKEYSLLGIYGIPSCVRDMFDETIYFQNSVDQDYSFDTWDKVGLFKCVAEKWKNCTDEYMVRNLDLDEDQKKYIDYFRRSGCYSEIWNTYISDTLYNDNSVVYFSCLGYYDLDFVKRFLVRCEEELIKKGFLKDDTD